MLTSRLTSKGQATIPAEVRKALSLEQGDHVSFEIQDNKVVLSKISQFDRDYYLGLSKQLSEWSSIEDEEAYRDL